MAFTDPVLLIGAGRLGGAMLDGWGLTGAVSPERLLVRARTVTPAAQRAADRGAALNPPDDRLSTARAVVLGMKPLALGEAAAVYAPHLAADAVIVSLLVGVSAQAASRAFGGRPVVRVMPTTAVAIGRGAASLYADDTGALAVGHALFDPVATTVDLADEALMPAAAAVSGSGPAYLYAFVEALEAAGVSAGLPEATARALAEATITGAAAYLTASAERPQALRAQVASPGGTTEAALKVLMDPVDGFPGLLRRGVEANISRGAEIAAAASSAPKA
jgi:pyrroline-5-carboxylate reductase